MVPNRHFAWSLHSRKTEALGKLRSIGISQLETNTPSMMKTPQTDLARLMRCAMEASSSSIVSTLSRNSADQTASPADGTHVASYSGDMFKLGARFRSGKKATGAGREAMIQASASL